jgi:hypothetical protein
MPKDDSSINDEDFEDEVIKMVLTKAEEQKIDNIEDEEEEEDEIEKTLVPEGSEK